MPWNAFVAYWTPSGADAATRPSKQLVVAMRETKALIDAWAADEDNVAKAVADHGAGAFTVPVAAVAVPLWAVPLNCYYRTTDRVLVPTPLDLYPLRKATWAAHHAFIQREAEGREMAPFHNQEYVDVFHNAMAQAHRAMRILVTQSATWIARTARVTALSVADRVKVAEQMVLGPKEFTDVHNILENFREYQDILTPVGGTLRIPASPLLWVDPFSDPIARISYKHAINFSGVAGYVNSSEIPPYTPLTPELKARPDFVAGMDMKITDIADHAAAPTGDWINEINE